MIFSSLRLALVGLFLFVVTSDSVEAASIPTTGPVYVIGAASACGSPPLVTLETRVLSSPALAKLMIEWYENYSPSFAPAYVDTYSSTVIPTDGSCVSSVLHLNGAGSFTMYSRVISKEFVPDAQTVSDYTLQEVITLCTAFVALCIGWSCGLKS